MLAENKSLSKIFNAQRKNVAQPEVVLNYLELYYLRLYTHGLKYREICKFLEMDYFKTYYVLKNIKKKFNTSNWVEIILKAFKSNHLNKLDFINDAVKENTLAYSKILYQNCFNQSRSSFSLVLLKIEVSEYYNICENLFSQPNNGNYVSEKLTLVETKCINLRFEGKSIAEILLELEITEQKHKNLIKSIFKKLNANNWFSVFKKAFQLNILNKTEEHFIFAEKEFSNTAKKILTIKSSLELAENEKKLAIYNELLELYSSIEFFYLKQNKETQVKNLKTEIINPNCIGIFGIKEKAV